MNGGGNTVVEDGWRPKLVLNQEQPEIDGSRDLHTLQPGMQDAPNSAGGDGRGMAGKD
jgi:hypothetical protein